MSKLSQSDEPNTQDSFVQSDNTHLSSKQLIKDANRIHQLTSKIHDEEVEENKPNHQFIEKAISKKNNPRPVYKKREGMHIKGQWTPEEDDLLVNWVQRVGHKRWAQCAATIFGRTGKQCRERWYNNLDPNVKKGDWTAEEDNFIFDHYVKQGSSWSKIAKLLTGRTENSVKNRFYSTVRKLLQDQTRQVIEDEEFLKQNELYRLLIEHKVPIKKTLAMQDYSQIYKELKAAKQHRVRLRQMKEMDDYGIVEDEQKALPNEDRLLDLIIGLYEIENLLKGLM